MVGTMALGLGESLNRAEVWVKLEVGLPFAAGEGLGWGQGCGQGWQVGLRLGFYPG